MSNLEELAKWHESCAARTRDSASNGLASSVVRERYAETSRFHEDAAAAIRELLAERESFHMRYRMEADTDVKAAIVRAEAAEAKLAELLAQKPVALVAKRMLGNEPRIVIEEIPGSELQPRQRLYAAPVPTFDVDEAMRLHDMVGFAQSDIERLERRAALAAYLKGER